MSPATALNPPPGHLQTSTGLIIPATAFDPAPKAAIGGIFGYAGSSGNYTAATKDTSQNSVYFPELRSNWDLSQLDRIELMRKGRWCYSNTGIGARIVDGIAEMVGFMRPSPTTTDSDWNAEAKLIFEEIASSAMIFDQAAEENFYARQITLTKKALTDGDCLLALTETSSGNPSTALYEAPQIGNPKGKTYNDGWIDGVQKNSLHRRLAFGILDENLRATDYQISATNALFFGNARPHAPRGITAFANFVKRLLDVRQMDNDQLAGIHAANLVGFYIKNNALQGGQQAAMVEEAIARNRVGQKPTAAEAKHLVEDILRDSGTMANLKLGQEIDTVHDERRHPNCEAFVSYLIRDMAWGTGFPPEVLWFLGQLTGPGVRYMIKSGEKAAKRYRRNLIDNYCRRIWVWTVAKLMKQGRLRQCKDPRWWACDWIEPESQTIDLGRDISSGLAEIKSGGNTFESWYGEASQDWRQQFRQRAIELAEAQSLEKEFALKDGTLLGQSVVNLTPQTYAAATAA